MNDAKPTAPKRRFTTRKKGGDSPYSKTYVGEKIAPMIRGSLLRHTTSSTRTFKLPTEVME